MYRAIKLGVTAFLLIDENEAGYWLDGSFTLAIFDK